MVKHFVLSDVIQISVETKRRAPRSPGSVCRQWATAAVLGRGAAGRGRVSGRSVTRSGCPLAAFSGRPSESNSRNPCWIGLVDSKENRLRMAEITGKWKCAAPAPLAENRSPKGWVNTAFHVSEPSAPLPRPHPAYRRFTTIRPDRGFAFR